MRQKCAAHSERFQVSAGPTDRRAIKKTVILVLAPQAIIFRTFGASEQPTLSSNPMTFLPIAVTWMGQTHRFLGLDWSYLMIIGFFGNLVFSLRFVVQWLASERKRESVVPVSFWYFSIVGSLLMLLYFIFRRDPVGILGFLPNSFIYLRNLYLIRRKNRPTRDAM